MFEKVKDSDADVVILAGLTEQNGGQLIKDKVAALGTNERASRCSPSTGSPSSPQSTTRARPRQG